MSTTIERCSKAPDLSRYTRVLPERPINDPSPFSVFEDMLKRIAKLEEIVYGNRTEARNQPNKDMNQ